MLPDTGTNRPSRLREIGDCAALDALYISLQMVAVGLGSKLRPGAMAGDELQGGEAIQTADAAPHRQPLGGWFLPARLFLSMASTYRSSERIPVSGIYRVVHAQHRLPHEVTLVEGQTFPPCAKCHHEVSFELVRGVPALERERRGSVSLYALPVIEEEEDATA